MAGIRKFEAATLELDSKPRPDSDAETWARRVYQNEDESQYHGVWQAAPGTHANLPGQETVYVVSGKATVSGTNGNSVEVSAGDIVVVDVGEIATWTVHETVRKVFIVNK